MATSSRRAWRSPRAHTSVAASTCSERADSRHRRRVTATRRSSLDRPRRAPHRSRSRHTERGLVVGGLWLVANNRYEPLSTIHRLRATNHQPLTSSHLDRRGTVDGLSFVVVSV